MSAAGNIRILMSHPDAYASVYLYTAWHGPVLHKILAKALDSKEGRARWQDEAYLARIIFGYMLKEADSPETGFGISTYDTGADQPDWVVDTKWGRVNGVPFEDFIELYKEDADA